MGYMLGVASSTILGELPAIQVPPTAYLLGRFLEAPQGKGLVSLRCATQRREERGAYPADQQIPDRHVCAVMPQQVGDRVGWALDSRQDRTGGTLWACKAAASRVPRLLGKATGQHGLSFLCHM